MPIKRLTIEHAEFIAHKMVEELMNFDDEPMPPFATVSNPKLEGSLAEPFQTFDGKMLHHRLTKRAAVMFYLVTKNHAFENGNKRMALALTLTFLYINEKWINIEPLKLYEIACLVAESDPKDKDKIIDLLNTAFKKTIISREMMDRAVEKADQAQKSDA
jgi:death-on-curing family protein